MSPGSDPWASDVLAEQASSSSKEISTPASPGDDPWANDVLAGQAPSSPESVLQPDSSREETSDVLFASKETMPAYDASVAPESKDLSVWVDYFYNNADEEDELSEFNAPEEFDGSTYLLSLDDVEDNKGDEIGQGKQPTNMKSEPSEKTVEKAQRSWDRVRGLLSNWRSNKPVPEESPTERRQRMDSMA